MWARLRWTGRRWRAAGEAGQTTVEYALVILAAAAIAGLVIAWATGSGAIGRLFDAALSRVQQMAS
jgi:hypothetical protein